MTTPTTRPGRLPRLVVAALVALATTVVFAALGGVGLAKSSVSAAQYQYGQNGKVTLCHKGKVTITVGKPAERAHRAHGDTPGACPTTATASQKGKAKGKAKKASASSKAKGKGAGRK